MYKHLNKIKKAGTVVRFHTNEMINRQTNAEHQHTCGLMAYTLAWSMPSSGIDPIKCMLYMLTHDLGEKRFGDMPGHVKELYPEIEKAERSFVEGLYPQFAGAYDELSKDERLLCYFCDKFDCLITSGNEVRKGNRELEYCFERTYLICIDIAKNFSHDILSEVMNDYVNDNSDIMNRVFEGLEEFFYKNFLKDKQAAKA